MEAFAGKSGNHSGKRLGLLKGSTGVSNVANALPAIHPACLFCQEPELRLGALVYSSINVATPVFAAEIPTECMRSMSRTQRKHADSKSRKARDQGKHTIIQRV